MDIKYELILTDKARLDLEDIYYYISKSLMADKAAENLINKIENSILRLENMPESCNIIIGLKEKNKVYRKLIINNYIVIYRIDETNLKVYIIRIVYGGKNYLNNI